MTRAEIREKHGISMIEHPNIANKELSDEEAKGYENFILGIVYFFEHFGDEDYFDDNGCEI